MYADASKTLPMEEEKIHPPWGNPHPPSPAVRAAWGGAAHPRGDLHFSGVLVAHVGPSGSDTHRLDTEHPCPSPPAPGGDGDGDGDDSPAELLLQQALLLPVPSLLSP